MTGCLEVHRLVPRLLALELPAELETEVREHLRTCEGCRTIVAEREPTLALALTLGVEQGPEDDRFVGEVLAGVHQRSLERRISRRRSRLLGAAAALAMVLLGGPVVLRQVERPAPQAVAATPQRQPQVVEPAFVEVDETGVRLYQLTPASQSREAIQVAFIVDPHLEL